MASKRARTHIPFKTLAPDDPKQSAQFVETARAAGATSGGAFARVFKKIVPKKKGARSQG